MKLTIELVPKSCWYSNVRSEVSPAKWDRLKYNTSKKAGGKCEICGGRGPKWPVECHEVWHYDDKKLIQKLERLIALCPSCHQVKHIGFAQIQGRGDEALKHLCKVNGLTTKQGVKYVNEAFEVWQKRSQKKWTLDISYLEET